jgi:hypothetical protein
MNSMEKATYGQKLEKWMRSLDLGSVNESVFLAGEQHLPPSPFMGSRLKGYA